MKPFKHFFIIEFKRLFSLIPLILGLLFLGAAVYVIQDGSDQFKDILKNKEEFKQIEQSKVKKYHYYTQYGAYGFRIQFIPSPVSIFFYDSGSFSELTANIDVGERLNLYNSFKGKNMFKERPGTHADFAGLFLLFGSLMCLFYGYDTFPRREYTKLLSSMAGEKRVYFQTFTARFLLLCLYFTLVTAVGIVIVILNGIAFTGTEYLYILCFLGIWLLLALSMFSVGTALRLIKSKVLGITLLMLTWIFLVYLYPLAVNKITLIKAGNMISNYQMELDKFNELVNFENRAIEDVGRYSKEKAKTQPGKQLVKSFLNREYKKIQKIEKKLEEQVTANIKLFQWLSVFSPTTFISSVTSEMSSKGYEGNLEFFKYNQYLKDKFCLFYFEKEYDSPPGEKEIESFIKEEENIFTGSARLPGNFGWGLLVLLVYCVGVFWLSYFAFKKALHSVEEEDNKDEKEKEDKAEKEETAADDLAGFQLEKAKYRVLHIEDNSFKDEVYNHLSAEHGNDSLYLCHQCEIPGDIRVRDFLSLAAALLGVELSNQEKEAYPGPFRRLDKLEKFKVLLDLTEPARRAGKTYYLFHNLTRDMPIEAYILLKDHMEALAAEGVCVVYLTRDNIVTDVQLHRKSRYSELPTWSVQVEQCKKMLDSHPDPV